jgi:hypothetical protein
MSRGDIASGQLFDFHGAGNSVKYEAGKASAKRRLS